MSDATSDYLLEQTGDPETMAAEVRSDIITQREKRNKIIRLRRMGLTYEGISDAIERDPESDYSVSPATAQRTVTHYLEKMANEDSESVDVVRELECQCLDHMQKSLAEKVSKGSVPAIKASLQIMERRAKLLGLDAIEIKGIVGAFANVSDVADPQAVQEATDAFVAAFQRPGIPDVPKKAIETSGREGS